MSFLPFFQFHRFLQPGYFYLYIPGIWSETADALRVVMPLHFQDCTPVLRVAIPWRWLTSSFTSISPPHTTFSSHFLEAVAGEKSFQHIEFHLGFMVLAVDVIDFIWISKPLVSFCLAYPFGVQTVYVLLVPRTSRNALVDLTKFFATQKAALSGNCLGCKLKFLL